MIVDSSAVAAVVFQEPGFEEVQAKLSNAATLGMGTPTLCETGIVVCARMKVDARPLLRAFINEAGIELIPFSEEHWTIAVGGFLKYGKGRHKAGLNFGDCLSYATAHLARQPLLYVGDDFSHTDIEAAHYRKSST